MGWDHETNGAKVLQLLRFCSSNKRRIKQVTLNITKYTDYRGDYIWLMCNIETHMEYILSFDHSWLGEEYCEPLMNRHRVINEFASILHSIHKKRISSTYEKINMQSQMIKEMLNDMHIDCHIHDKCDSEKESKKQLLEDLKHYSLRNGKKHYYGKAMRCRSVDGFLDTISDIHDSLEFIKTRIKSREGARIASKHFRGVNKLTESEMNKHKELIKTLKANEYLKEEINMGTLI